MTDQLRPPNAAYIWYTPSGWRCELPGPKGTSHTILVPEEKVGSLLAMLKVRSSESKIGEAGDKTQFQLDKDSLEAAKKAYKGPVKRKSKLSISEETRMNVRDVIRRLGLA